MNVVAHVCGIVTEPIVSGNIASGPLIFAIVGGHSVESCIVSGHSIVKSSEGIVRIGTFQ